VAETPKQEIRIPEELWQGSQRRAESVHATSAARCVRVLLELFIAGELDPVITAALAAGGGATHSGHRAVAGAASAGTGSR